MPRVKVTIIKNTHPSKEFQSQALNDAIAQSQYSVVQTILKKLAVNPNIPVMRENHPETYSDDYSKGKLRELFPKGFPDAYDKLTSRQKDFLTKNGGTSYLLYSGNIKKIYSANLSFISNKEKFYKEFGVTKAITRNEDTLSQEFANVDQAAELLDLEKGICHALESGTDEVINVIGASHKVSDLIKCLSEEVEIEIVDLSFMPPPNDKVAYDDLMQEYDKFRGNVNCNYLLDKFRPVSERCPSHYKQIYNSAEVTTTNATINSALIFTGLVTTGVLIYGLFKCCQKRDKETKNTADLKAESNKATVKKGKKKSS